MNKLSIRKGFGKISSPFLILICIEERRSTMQVLSRIGLDKTVVSGFRIIRIDFKKLQKHDNVTIDKDGKYTYLLENGSSFRWLKIEDLEIGRNSAYKLINNGSIKSLRIGRNIRIPKIYLLDYLTTESYNKDSNMLYASMSTGKGA